MARPRPSLRRLGLQRQQGRSVQLPMPLKACEETHNIVDDGSQEACTGFPPFSASSEVRIEFGLWEQCRRA